MVITIKLCSMINLYLVILSYVSFPFSSNFLLSWALCDTIPYLAFLIIWKFVTCKKKLAQKSIEINYFVENIINTNDVHFKLSNNFLIGSFVRSFRSLMKTILYAYLTRILSFFLFCVWVITKWKWNLSM